MTRQYSIVLPVRNGGGYVKECVHSILKQTYPHFNLIVLDNNSTDGTLEWLQGLGNDRIVIHTSPDPLTITGNWARIKAVARNEFMTIIGHDDVLKPDYLEKMHQLIQKYPDAGLYQAHFEFIDDKGRLLRLCKPMAEKLTAAEFLACHIHQSLDSMGTGYMFRSRDFDAAGGMPENYPALLFADYELWLRLSALSYMAATKEILFGYRLHNSTSKSADAIMYQDAFLEYCSFLEQLQLADADVREMIARNGHKLFNFYATTLSHRLLRIPRKQRDRTVKAFLKACRLLAVKLMGKGHQFKPGRVPQILAALLIDGFGPAEYLFFKYRKWRYGSE